jgi:C4-dicarboxylate-binding protein DctP
MNFKKQIFSGLIAASFFSGAVAQEKFVVTSEVPIKTNPSPYIVEFVDRVEELTGGELIGEYFEAARLYTDTEGLAALGTGTVQFVFPVSTRLEQFDPRSGIVNLPFMITYEQMRDECFHNEVTSLVNGYMSEGSMKILGFLRTAELIFLMADDPINALENLDGKKIRLVGGKVMQNAMRSVGVSPVSMAASEMAVAMSQGAIDGAVTSPAGWAHVLGSAADYGILFPGMSLATSAIAVDDDWYTSLPVEYKDAIDTAVNELIDKQWVETVQKDENLINQMISKGGDYSVMDSDETAKMKEKFSDAVSMFTSRYPEVVRKYDAIVDKCGS